MPRPRRWTDEQLAVAVASSATLSDVCRQLDLSPGSKTYFSLRRAIERLGLDASHLPRLEPKMRYRQRRFTDEDLVQAVAASSSLADVMRALVERAADAARARPHRDHTDNRLENLRLLCRNCHALTDTWCYRKRS